MQHLFITWSLKSQLFISFSKDSRHLFTLSEWPTLAHSSSLKDLSSFMPPYVHCSTSTHSQLDIEVSLQKSVPQRCIAWLLSKHHSRYSHLHFSSCLTIWIFFFKLAYCLYLYVPLTSLQHLRSVRKRISSALVITPHPQYPEFIQHCRTE